MAGEIDTQCPRCGELPAVPLSDTPAELALCHPCDVALLLETLTDRDATITRLTARVAELEAARNGAMADAAFHAAEHASALGDVRRLTDEVDCANGRAATMSIRCAFAEAGDKQARTWAARWKAMARAYHDDEIHYFHDQASTRIRVAVSRSAKAFADVKRLTEELAKPVVTRASQTCVYLRDGTKVVLHRDGKLAQTKTWLEVEPQARITTAKGGSGG